MPEETLIGYDCSESAQDLVIVCTECAECLGSDELGPELHLWEEWGGPVPPCRDCGCVIDGLVEI